MFLRLYICATSSIQMIRDTYVCHSLYRNTDFIIDATHGISYHNKDWLYWADIVRSGFNWDTWAAKK